MCAVCVLVWQYVCVFVGDAPDSPNSRAKASVFYSIQIAQVFSPLANSKETSLALQNESSPKMKRNSD